MASNLLAPLGRLQVEHPQLVVLLGTMDLSPLRRAL